MKNNILKKESLLYGTGHILTRLITFLLLPVFTNILTPFEYGIVSLVYTFIGFFVVILHFGMDAALLKHYKLGNTLEKKQFLTNMYVPLFVINVIFLIISILLKDSLPIYILGVDNPLIFMMMISILFFDVLWSIPMVLLRANNKPYHFITFNMINVISNIGFIYIFVILYKLSILGIVFSNLLSSALLFIGTVYIVFNEISIKLISKKTFQKMFHFGFPLMFSGIFAMVIELSDRYIIKYLLNIEMVGIYNAGYKLGMLMLLVVVGFNLAWQPFFLDKKNQKNSHSIGILANKIFLVFSIICCGILCFVEPLMNINIWGFKVLGPNFQNSISIIPWICVGYLFHGACILQLAGPYITGKTIYVAVVRGFGAIVNIVCNFYLIPIYGISGAAISTCFTFISMAILLFIINRKIYYMKYNYYMIFCSIFIVCIIMFIINTNPTFILRILSFSMIPGILLLMGCFTKNEIELAKNKVYKILND